MNINTKGLKTTEFWVGLVVMVVLAFSKSLGLDLDENSVMGVVGLAVSYIGGRSWFKGKKAEAMSVK